MKLFRIHGQPSWKFSLDKVAAVITRQGGHLAPVRFRLPRGVVQPYSIAPWAEEKVAPKIPAMLRTLRGDFFCLPFGNNDTTWRGEKHPAHGEIAHQPWRFESLEKSAHEVTLRLSIETKVRSGHVAKSIRLRKGETALYCRHVISGMSGKMNLGHHAMLKFPEAAASGLISMSPLLHGQVFPSDFEQPATGGYSSLKPGAFFSQLNQVPAMNGTVADLSSYPLRRGFEDVAMVVHEASADFAWTAVTFPEKRYVWFALKDPRVLRSTLLWCSNGGRHYPPWNGRHLGVLGIEDVTSYFHLGLAESVKPNRISLKGIPTFLTLHKSAPLVVNYIMAVASIPRRWGRVKTITPDRKGVLLAPDHGRPIRVPLDFSFIHSTP